MQAAVVVRRTPSKIYQTAVNVKSAIMVGKVRSDLCATNVAVDARQLATLQDWVLYALVLCDSLMRRPSAMDTAVAISSSYAKLMH